MAELSQCEFFLLRYMPNAANGEFANVGVFVRDTAGTFTDVRFTRDWRRVLCMDPDADIELLSALEDELRRALRSQAELDQVFLFQKLPDWASNAIQLTPMQGVLTDSPAAEIGRLAEMYCESPRRAARREISGRQAIRIAMRDSFQQAGIWNLLRHDIPVELYTRKGDPLKIDCGYRPNGIVHLLHGVSLTTSVDSAVLLASRYPQIRDGIARLENAKTTLTAIVEDDLDRKDDAVAFAFDTLADASIFVATTSDLQDVAQRIRREMRM
jgi:Protein of unknown function (DUF3037)